MHAQYPRGGEEGQARLQWVLLTHRPTRRDADEEGGVGPGGTGAGTSLRREAAGPSPAAATERSTQGQHSDCSTATVWVPQAEAATRGRYGRCTCVEL